MLSSSLLHHGVEGYPVGYIEQLVTGVSDANDVFIDSQGYMYIVTDYSRVYKASAIGGAISVFAGGGSVTSGSNIPATSAKMGQMNGICGDTAGNLYWGDVSYHVIWYYASGKVNIIAEVYGSSNYGYTPDGQPALGNEIYHPW